MHGVWIIGIVFSGVIMGLMVVGGTILMAIRLIRGGGVSKQDRKVKAEESAMIQDILNGLTKMEERVKALETILLKREKGDGI
jgi:phage shock protein B